MTLQRKFGLSIVLSSMALLAALTITRSYAAGGPSEGEPNVQQQAADPAMREAERAEIEKQNTLSNPPSVAESIEKDGVTPADLERVEQHDAAVELVAPPPVQQQVLPAKNAENVGETPRSPILASRQLSYQAVLTDNAGVALPGPTVNLAFNIYNTVPALVEGPINVLGVPINDGVVDTSFPVSASTFDGSDRLLGISVNGGAELSPRISLTAVAYAIRVDRVASEELDDAITLGRGSAPLAAGSLSVQNGVQAQPTVVLSGSGHQISTYGSDGLEQIRLWGPSYGELWLNDNTGNETTVFMRANGDSGGEIVARDAAGANRVTLLGQSAGTGGEISLADDDGTETIELLGAASAAEGGQIMISNAVGTDTIQLDGDSGDAAFIALRNTAGSNRITLDGDSSGAGLVTMYQTDGSSGITIDADAGTNVGGLLGVNDSVSSARVQLDGESTGTGGEVRVFDDNGSETVELLGAETTTTGGQIVIRDSAGVAQIELDGEFGVTGDPGRIVTPVLQITGGSDLSEDFDVSGENVSPGMVVCIDEKNPGKLLISSNAYDRKVAGIVSGANGVRTGLLMGQKKAADGDASIADGKYPVALTGRVYCQVDATEAEIAPGDMLTTSSTPGHAMKVLDHGKAHGAVIGKAMSGLAKGEKGLVLVLVNMQ